MHKEVPRLAAWLAHDDHRGTVAVSALLSVSLLLRVALAQRLTLQVDEAASILAAKMVAERGIPLLPSGVLYLQGTPLSYALAPLVWLGFADVSHLTALRLGCAVAGVVAVYAAFRLAVMIIDWPLAAWLVALLVALEPISAEWSAHVRMYAPLQALTLVIAWQSLALLRRPTGHRLLIVVSLAWMALLTHAAAVLIMPGVITAIVIVAWCHDAIRVRASIAGLAIAVAPLGLVTLNRVSGLERRLPGGNASEMPFVGGQLLDLTRVLHPDFQAWHALLGTGMLGAVMPWLIGASAALAAIASLRVAGFRRRACVVLGMLYAGPVLGIALLTSAAQPRYLVGIHPIAFVAMGMAMNQVHGMSPSSRQSWHGRAGMVLSMGLALIFVIHAISGLASLWRAPVIGPDYPAAFAFVRAHHTSNAPIVVSLPAVAALELGPDAPLIFLAGSEEGVRAQRYTWQTPDGRTVDFWLGRDAIVSTQEFCALLAAHPDAWLVVDEQRIGAGWAYGGSMRRLILGLTYGTYRAPGGAVVRRVAPPEQQIPEVRKMCQDALGSATG